MDRQNLIIETKRSQAISTNRDAYKSSYQSSRLVYDLRKEVLDKLDIILQKVNLSVLKCLDSGSKSIKLISMTQLEEEIEDLFAKLDECILNREKSFKIYDSGVYAENQLLARENEKLRQANEELIERLQEMESQRQTPLSQISALQREVENLNSQIDKYGGWRESNSVDEDRYLSHNKLLINLHKIIKESGRVRLAVLAIKKIFKQYSQSFAMAKNDFAEKLESVTRKWTDSMKDIKKQNQMLRQQLGSWEAEVEGVMSRIRQSE